MFDVPEETALEVDLRGNTVRLRGPVDYIQRPAGHADGPLMQVRELVVQERGARHLVVSPRERTVGRQDRRRLYQRQELPRKTQHPADTLALRIDVIGDPVSRRFGGILPGGSHAVDGLCGSGEDELVPHEKRGFRVDGEVPRRKHVEHVDVARPADF